METECRYRRLGHKCPEEFQVIKTILFCAGVFALALHFVPYALSSGAVTIPSSRVRHLAGSTPLSVPVHAPASRFPYWFKFATPLASAVASFQPEFQLPSSSSRVLNCNRAHETRFEYPPIDTRVTRLVHKVCRPVFAARSSTRRPTPCRPPPQGSCRTS